MSERTFIYALICPDTNEVRYVGKSDNPHMRYKSHICGYHNKQSHKSRWVQSLIRQGKCPRLEILEEVNSDNWVEAEKKWIAFYRENSHNLTNFTDGGQGGNTGQRKRAVTYRAMSIRLPDNLMFWLEREAKGNNISTNSYIIKILDQIRTTHQLFYRTDSTQLCNNRHHWNNPNPATSEPCNCGAFVFGEVVCKP